MPAGIYPYDIWVVGHQDVCHDPTEDRRNSGFLTISDVSARIVGHLPATRERKVEVKYKLSDAWNVDASECKVRAYGPDLSLLKEYSAPRFVGQQSIVFPLEMDDLGNYIFLSVSR